MLLLGRDVEAGWLQAQEILWSLDTLIYRLHQKARQEQQTSFTISFETLRRHFAACNMEQPSLLQLKSLTSSTNGKVSKRVKNQTTALANMAMSSPLLFGLVINAVNATAKVA